jgi:pimeloyl-ACP methyl ester carboxylesterase
MELSTAVEAGSRFVDVPGGRVWCEVVGAGEGLPLVVLHEIDVPTLFTCGRHDEATPETVGWYTALVPNAALTVFDESSHLAHLEERERYFIQRGEGRPD